jgi:hypothetical protein
VVDGLKGFPEAITSVFSKTVVQTCIVHLIRNSMQFASWKEHRAVAAALKPIYQAESAAAARERLEDFDRGPWGQKYPAVAQSWRRKWEQVIPFFAFAPEVRKILYTTNAIESLNAQCVRRSESAGIFPAKKRRPNSSGWCCARYRPAGKIRRFSGRRPKPSWRSSSRTAWWWRTENGCGATIAASLRTVTPSRVRALRAPTDAALDCDRRSGSESNHAVADATASLIKHWLQEHEIPDTSAAGAEVQATRP